MASQNVSIETLRSKAMEIAVRCKQDKEFKTKLETSPRATIEEFGIPPENVNDVLGHEGPGGKGICITTNSSFIICVCCGSGSC